MFVARRTFITGLLLTISIVSIYANEEAAENDVDAIKDIELDVIENLKPNSTSLLDEENDSELITSFAITQVSDGLKFDDLPILDLRYHTIPGRCAKSYLPSDCTEATSCTQRSGIYKIGLVDKPSIFVPCDADTEYGGWTVIQRRQDGTEDFYRNWADYENGFGNLNGEFFIGLKNLYALTNLNGPQELLIIMESPDLVLQYARYDTFVIGNANENYALKQLGQFSGTARDSFRIHAGMPFTTKDRNNGPNKPDNCANIFTGAWWYINCMTSNLNGVYGKNSGNGVYWHGTVDNSIQKYVKMMIRRRRYY